MNNIFLFITIQFKIDVILYVNCMGDFTLRLPKIIEKMILPECVLSMLHVGQREKTKYSALTSS